MKMSPTPARSEMNEPKTEEEARASVVSCGEVPFPLLTNRKPSTETGAAHIICHPELAKDLTAGRPALCHHSPFSKLTAPRNSKSLSRLWSTRVFRSLSALESSLPAMTDLPVYPCVTLHGMSPTQTPPVHYRSPRRLVRGATLRPSPSSEGFGCRV